MTWNTISPALYRQLLDEAFLTLPSVRYLKRITSSLSVETGLTNSTIEYLKARLKSLSEWDKIIALLMDEVYCIRRTEYVAGKLHGNSEDNTCAKTLLCYMIASVAGTYRDMVAMIPISKIDATIIQNNFQKIVKALSDIGLELVAMSVDGHSSNRKFYQMLCGGSLAPSIAHPVYPGKRIFLLFDPVHLFKNFYTNLLNKRIFLCPPYQGAEASPSLSDIEELYQKELGKGLKVAHRLSHKVLKPHLIERSNVSLADSFFHETTIAALRFYGQERALTKWNSTAKFLELVRTWFNILNVRTTSAGIRKRDDFKKPISSFASSSLSFLHEFGAWLKVWKETAEKGKALSRETFQCAEQTTKGYPDLAKYLLENKQLGFVLLGKVGSDPIERRFGCYRQLAGANYYLSVRQFIEAEKAIRIKSLVMHSGMDLKAIQECMMEQPENDSTCISVVKDIQLETEEESLEFETVGRDVANTTYYVAGYVTRALMKNTSCQDCKSVMKGSSSMSNICTSEGDGDAPESAESLLRQVNRGGLIAPSDLLYIYCLHAEKLRQVIFGNEQAKAIFLSSSNIKAVFATLLHQKMMDQEGTRDLLYSTCESEHPVEPWLKIAARTYCNCMMKNYTSEVNDHLHEARKRATKGGREKSQDRKLVKLTE